MSATVIFYTNIATPYRIEFFNHLNIYKFSFSVWYQKTHVPYRRWSFSDFKHNYQYVLGNGIFFSIFNHPIFFCPQLIIKLVKEKPRFVILGLAWNDLDALLIILFKIIGIHNTKICFWSEANYLTNGSRKSNFFKKWIRKFVYNNSEFHIRSGKMTDITLKKWGIQTPHFISLPNVIQESVFENLSLKNNKNSKIIILISARLIERLKGIKNFISSLSSYHFEKIQIRVAGDGEDKIMLNNFIYDNKLNDSVLLLGELNPKDLANELSQADVFCLPSFSDASPLSVFEAMCVGLPLLISERCGNHFEAVYPGKNGYIFDPDNKIEIQKCVDKLIKLRHKLPEMGRLSKKYYITNLSKYVISKKFIKDLNKALDN